MPRYDQHTQDFMRELMGDMEPSENGHAIVKSAGVLKSSTEAPAATSAPESERIPTKPLRLAKQLLRGMEDPRKAIGKAVVRLAAHELMDKEGSIKILSLYKFMNEHYKREWWDWEPETIWTMLEQDHLDATPDELRNAIQALQVILNTFAPFEHWHIFENVGHAFNMNPVSFAVVQPLEPDEAALTMEILRRIRPATEYEVEVLIYIATCAKVAGMVYLPDDMFPGVQKYLDEITFEHLLRDATKKVWENPKDGISSAQHRSGISRDQVEVQIYRLLDVKRYLSKEVGDA